MNSSPISVERPNKTNWVLDASAVLALTLTEPGARRVRECIDAGGAISTVNFTEVLTRMIDLGDAPEDALATLRDLALSVIALDEVDALQAAVLRSTTRSHGLSLGDRCCLALAGRLALPVLTADRNWSGLDIGIAIELCR